MTARRKLTLLALGFVVVAGVLGAGAGGSAPNDGAPPVTGSLESDWIRGGFWRPAGSVATRPPLRLERVAWTPPELKSRHSDDPPLTAPRSILPLAAND